MAYLSVLICYIENLSDIVEYNSLLLCFIYYTFHYSSMYKNSNMTKCKIFIEAWNTTVYYGRNLTVLSISLYRR